ncbi:inhibin beta chain [Dermacentor silvarum]|uniref:inhibin beta chain n=1 Tax=Dermacentor silvarum TaxID=543639 RepID=UPI0018982F44|nr:inhibin beta chain [Dermacentor silvarum]
MAGGALQAALAAALLLAGCGGRCTAGVGVHDGGGGAPPPSSAALDGDDQRQLKLDAVRHQILSKLSLRERPPQHRESAPPLARELALEALRRVHLLPEPRALEDQGAPDPRQEDDYYGRTAEIIAFAEPGLTVNGHVLLDFHQNPDRPTHRLRVVSASLWLYVRSRGSSSPSASNRTATLYVFRVAESNSSSAPLSGGMDLLAALEVDASAASHGWRRVDLRAAVQHWFAPAAGHHGHNARKKLTLLVDCVGCGPAGIQVAQFERRQRRRPFLAVATEALVSRRRGRRFTITCGEGVTQCCKQSLYVSFEDLGWDDWIIAPKGYFANYCMGECAGRPRTPDMFRYFHAHVLEEYRLRNPYASVSPCCAPTKLSPMSLIYFDRDHNIIKSDLPKMIVDECGCT